MKNNLEFRYRHYRVPSILFDPLPPEEKKHIVRTWPEKGAPLPGWLKKYSRKHGFGVPYHTTIPHTSGGMTVCAAFDDGKCIRTAVAVCSMSECFCYKEGRDRARDRIEAEFQYLQDMEDLDYKQKGMIATGEQDKARELTSDLLVILRKLIDNLPVLHKADEFEALIKEDNPWALIHTM